MYKIYALFLIFFTMFPPGVSAEEPVGKVVSVEGRADITRPGASAVPAAPEDMLYVGDIIRTKSRSKTAVAFADGSVLRLGASSRVEITEYLFEEERIQASLKLFRGKIQSIVNKAKSLFGMSEPNRFEIRTPTAVIGVRGTNFFTHYQDGVSRSVFIEGKGYCYSLSQPDQIREIYAGQAMTVVSPYAPPVIRPVTDTEIQKNLKDTAPAPKLKEGEDDGDSDEPMGLLTYFQQAKEGKKETLKSAIAEELPDEAEDFEMADEWWTEESSSDAGEYAEKKGQSDNQDMHEDEGGWEGVSDTDVSFPTDESDHDVFGQNADGKTSLSADLKTNEGEGGEAGLTMETMVYENTDDGKLLALENTFFTQEEAESGTEMYEEFLRGETTEGEIQLQSAEEQPESYSREDYISVRSADNSYGDMRPVSETDPSLVGNFEIKSDIQVNLFSENAQTYKVQQTFPAEGSVESEVLFEQLHIPFEDSANHRKWIRELRIDTDWGTGLDGSAHMAWIDIDLALTGVGGGEFYGMFEPDQYTLNMEEAWYAVTTSTFLEMTKSNTGRAELAEMNIPAIEIGRASLSGSSDKLNVQMNDVTFFSYRTGGDPRIWATNDISGDFNSVPETGHTVHLSGSGLDASFNITHWNNNTWAADINGSGTVGDVKTGFSGYGAGQYDGTSSGSFQGTGAGLATQ